MSGSREALAGLVADSVFARLNAHVPRLSLFRVLGVVHDELAHSRLIAALLDPQSHAGGVAALRSLVGAVGEQFDAAPPAATARLAALRAAEWSSITVQRELYHIDIVVQIWASAGHVVLGIENKIGAAEQEGQIARYQDALATQFSNATAVMVFLTPNGRRPDTADPQSPVPCVSLGYSSVLMAAEAALEHAQPGSADEHTLVEIANHFREDILDNDELRNAVRELWRTHGRALQLALRYRPRLEDIRERYEQILRDSMRERFGLDLAFEHYPTRGELREIKMTIDSWVAVGLPFTFMLYGEQGERAKVRLLVDSACFEANPRGLTKWATSANARCGAPFDEEFRPLSNWTCWRRVLREEEYPDAAALDDRGFDESTAQEAATRVLRLVELVRQHVPLIAAAGAP